MKIRGLCYTLFFIALLSGPSWSQETAKPDGGKTVVDGEDMAPLKLSYKQAVALALHHNLDIKIDSYNPRILDTEIDKALANGPRGSFDPMVTASAQFSQTRTPRAPSLFAQVQGLSSGNDLFTDSSKTWTFSTSIEQTFLTGTNYNLTVNSSHLRTEQNTGISSAYRPQVVLTVTQPLLKGFGFLPNEAQILIAKNSKLISDQQFRLTVIQTLQNVQNAYWDLVLSVQELELKKKSLEVAKELLRIAKLRHGVGSVAAIEITSARAGVATRNAEVIDARNKWRDASEKLLSLILSHKEIDQINRQVEPTDTPEELRENLDLAQAIQLALNNRPELIQAHLEINSKMIALESAENGLLPEFGITGTFTWNGLGDELDDSVEEMDGRFLDYSFGAQFSYPIFNRAARADYEKALLERQQAKLKLSAARRDVLVAVRSAVRSLKTAQESYLARKEASRLALEKLEAERTRYKVGKSTNHQVFQIEEEYTDARTKELAAQINIAKARIVLEVATGALLKKNNVEVMKLLPSK